MNLVVGSTGLLGRQIVKKLLSKRTPVRAMVRKESDRQALEAMGATTVIGDLKDPASLDAALRGVTTVITTANAAQRGGDDTIASVDLTGNQSLIDAAKRAGVRQFIFVSTALAEESSPVPIFAAKAKAEAHLRSSGIPWTIIAATAFMDVWFPMIIGSAVQSGQPVALVGGGKTPHSFIAVDDVSEFVVATVGNPAAIGQRLVIGGPAPVSWSEAVETAGQSLGRRLQTQNIEPGQPIPTLPAPANQFIGFMMAGLEQNDVVVDTTATARAFRVSLTPAEAVLERVFGGLGRQ